MEGDGEGDGPPNFAKSTLLKDELEKNIMEKGIEKHFLRQRLF